MITCRLVEAGEDRWGYFRTELDARTLEGKHSGLESYYTAGGAPSAWIGSAASSLGLAPGGPVDGDAFQRLIERGEHPLTEDPLGAPFRQVTPVDQRIAVAVAALPKDLSASERAERVAAIEKREAAKGSHNPVAAFELVFNPPKSVSAVWALADAATKTDLVAAHQAALQHTMAVLERDYARTRLGTNGVLQAETKGVVAAAFDHWDTRNGDPQLHTHVLVANRAQGPDGKWRTLDSRGALMPGVIALSETYDAALRDELTARFGCGWTIQEVSADPEHYQRWLTETNRFRRRDGQRPLRDSLVTRERYALDPRGLGLDRKNLKFQLDGVPNSLLAEWSTRVTQIDPIVEQRKREYVARYGHEPSGRTVSKWRAQTALSTRKGKEHGKELATMTATWRGQAAKHIGDSFRFVERILNHSSPQVLLRDDDVFAAEHLEWISRQALLELSESKTTWRRSNAVAAVLRATRTLSFATAQDRDGATRRCVDTVLAQAVRVTIPTGRVATSRFQSPDGASAFEPEARALYTTADVLAAERHILARAHDLTGPTATVLQPAPVPAGKHPLSSDQREAVEHIVASGRCVDVLVGPAGAGKTTTLKELRRQWEAAHGPGAVIGLAPSAAAAAVLGDELEISTENTAKWLLDGGEGGELRAGSLLIVDEAGMSGTHAMNAIIARAEAAGAKVLLVGDHAQLAAVDAGGAFGMLTRRIPHAELTQVFRFKAAWEADASIALREGSQAALATYAARGRVKDGDRNTMMRQALEAWKADVAAGKTSLLLAADNPTVVELSNAAQEWRRARGELGGRAGVIASDQQVFAGDQIVCRSNDRTLLIGDTWVRNGSSFTVQRVHSNGRLTVQDPTTGQVGTIPAEYAREHVQLGYAVTVHRAQGRTVDTTHSLVDTSMTRGSLYVALTRGRDSNRIYVDTGADEFADGLVTNDPHTWTEVCARVLDNTGQEQSATDTMETERDRLASVRQLADEYETILSAANETEFTPMLAQAGLDVDHLSQLRGWPILMQTMRRYLATGSRDQLAKLLAHVPAVNDDVTPMTAVIAKAAAALRGDRKPERVVGLIDTARQIADPQIAAALQERARAAQLRAELTLDAASTAGEPWVRELGAPVPGRQADWRRAAITIAAYRDRWKITASEPTLGPALNPQQRRDRAAAKRALDTITKTTAEEPNTKPPKETTLERSTTLRDNAITQQQAPRHTI